MISWIKLHLIWSTVVLLSLVAVLLILTDSFKAGVLVLAAAAGVLATARAAGATDKLLAIRTKRLDIGIYLGFALSLTLLAIVIPVG
jgi:hypothetical protein